MTSTHDHRRPARVVAGLLAALTLGVAAPALAGEVIKDIVVEENTKTTDDTVILIADIEKGDDWSIDMIDQIKIDLVSSGLFKDVQVFSEPMPGGVRVHILAKDKHSWVVAPAFYNQPTNKGGGVGFGENNLFGENEKLLIYAQGATGDSFFVAAFVDPSIAGTRWRWQADVFLKSGRVIEYAPPKEWLDDPEPVRESRLNYLNGGLRLGVDLFGGAGLDARFRGAGVWYWNTELADGASIEDTTDDPAVTLPLEPGAEGLDVSTELAFTIDTRANWYGISQGKKFRAAFEQALPALGSDFDYWAATVSYERAIRFLERHNFITKARVIVGNDLPFQQELQAGGTDQRGWKNSQFRGDLKVAANLEYSVPLMGIHGFSIRGLAFLDSSYTTFLDTDGDENFRHYLPGSEARGLAPLKDTVGLGTRLYLRQIVLPLLGLDVGYGLERNSVEVYLAIGLTD